MLQLNYFILIGTSFIPLIIGFIWYNPKVFGNIWIKETGLSEEKLKESNMAIIFGLTILLGFFASVAMLPATIHQMSVYSVVQGNPDLSNPTSELSIWINQYMEKYGTNFRSFKHGALHGTITAIF